MAKFSQTLRMAFQHNGTWTTVELKLEDIDPSQPMSDQLSMMDEAVNITWDFAKNKIDNQVEEMITELNK